MKIGIIGASGKAGSRIALEAKRRRHRVTAIVRDPAKVEGRGYAVLQKDLFALVADDLKDFDAVVSAFGTAYDAASAPLHQQAMRHLTAVMEQLPAVRLLIIGGAASLYADQAKEHLVLESIPEEWRPVPQSVLLAFRELQKSPCRWTFFSPAVNFDADGPRTGKYVLGTDFVIGNGDGESYLSYADSAVAVVDELEDGRYIRKRFTAVSEKTPNKDGYCGTEKKRPVFEGVSRYRPHFSNELEGRFFHILMDRAGDIDVRFLSGRRLEYAQNGSAYREPYQCAKGADLAYFVNFELSGAIPRTNVTLIADLQTRLATVVKTCTRYSERYPTLCDHEYDFGAIDMPGYPLPRKRHGYTTDLVGKRINWHYGPDFAITHCYYHPNYVRATFTAEALKRLPPTSPEEREAWLENPYDEKAVYVKIRDGLYVVSFTEQSMSRRGGIGNSLLFLMNTDRVHDVGRSFGHTGQFGGQGYQPENYLFEAYGEFVTANGDEWIENDPPRYTV